MPDLEDAYALSDTDAVRDLYAQWAVSYDNGFGEAMGYQLPSEVARAFNGAGGQGPVLDLGAGTGLVAGCLAPFGVGPLDALDLSHEMLEVAKGKGLYRVLIAADFLSPAHGIMAESYAGIVSAGTFTHGHLGPQALAPLLGFLAPGGVAVISVNLAHFETAGFAAHVAALAEGLDHMETRDVRIYDDRAEGAHRTDLARLLILRK